MEFIAILVILLITFSVILIPNQWDIPQKKNRKRNNEKFKLPKEFWDDVNEMEATIYEMTEANAKMVFFRLTELNEKYRAHFMNYTYDQRMTHLIEKYNAKINYFHNQKTK